MDLVARATGPIVELLVEEGQQVSRGRLLARIDPAAATAAHTNAQATAEEARLAYERAESLHRDELISQEEFEQARARNLSAEAQLETSGLDLGYTEIRAPFSGLVVTRYIRHAQYVSPGTPLFRLSDFDPLLCPVQVPERELPRLTKGQRAEILVEAWPDQRFEARVLRISPTVESATGTVKVTLAVSRKGLLRPGMFAKVLLEIDRKEGALVIPKAALALEGIGDAVYVVEGEEARRREVRLGFSEGDHIEVLEGLSAGEQVVVVGQDGLSDGTPVRVLAAAGEAAAAGGPPQGPPGGGAPGGAPGAAGAEDGSREERIRERMRSMGMSEEEIDDRLEQMRQRFGGDGAPPAGGDAPTAGPPASGEGPRPAGQARGGPPGGAPDPARLEAAKERMRSMGMSEEEIEARVAERLERRLAGGGPPPPGGRGGAGEGPPFGPGFGGGELTDERIEEIRQRMRERGLTDEQIERRIEEIRARSAEGDG